MNLELTNFVSFILAQGGGQGGGMMTLFPLLLMFVMMYFLLIRPQRLRQKELAEQVARMKKGDKVISAGGIHGIVANIKDLTVIVKVAENVKLEFQKASITTIIPKGTEKTKENTANPDQMPGEPLKG